MGPAVDFHDGLPGHAALRLLSNLDDAMGPHAEQTLHGAECFHGVGCFRCGRALGAKRCRSGACSHDAYLVSFAVHDCRVVHPSGKQHGFLGHGILCDRRCAFQRQSDHPAGYDVLPGAEVEPDAPSPLMCYVTYPDSDDGRHGGFASVLQPIEP